MTGDVYLQMLQDWPMDELIANEHEHFICRQDRAPPHRKLTVRAYIKDNQPRRWIGRVGGKDNVMLKWPPRSPNLTTPAIFFLWGYVKILVYVPPSSCKCKRAQTKNRCRTGDSYLRLAASRLGGARRPT